GAASSRETIAHQVDCEGLDARAGQTLHQAVIRMLEVRISEIECGDSLRLGAVEKDHRLVRAAVAAAAPSMFVDRRHAVDVELGWIGIVIQLGSDIQQVVAPLYAGG